MGAFRIDHDQALQQTSFLRYQHGKDGLWVSFTWRYDSGEVAGAVTNLEDVLTLTASQQAVIGFAALRSRRVQPDHRVPFGQLQHDTCHHAGPGHFQGRPQSPRIAPRNLFDLGADTDNLFHKEKIKTTLKFTFVNLTNEAALYNFLSTFSGTHWVSPRAWQVSLGWVL